ncbi:MAG: M20 family metallopeptidase [Anaerolineales bacterium]|nr:M20 family metallopeptidase [Anaerolineales bacterium]
MPPLPITQFEAHMPQLIALIEKLVHIESPTTSKSGVDELGRFVAAEMEARGAQVRDEPQTDAGDHRIGTWGEGQGGLLLMVHLDTVHPLGTLEHMPFAKRENRLFGPGVLDMKVSIAMALTAIEILLQNEKLRQGRLTLLCTSDEETGSRTSRALIEQMAQEHEIVLCLEPALPGGSLKTWRKGTLAFRVEAVGKAAHAGSNIKDGVNAILEMAHQIPGIAALADEETETTVNVGVIQGGTRSNVVPDLCWLRVDVRAKTKDEGDRVLAAMLALEPILEGAEIQVKGGWNRQPMERNEQMIKTFQRAQGIARDLGLSVSEGGTGGGSDANFVAALGVPVLDGLGAIGTGAHTKHEQIETESLAERTALIAALISEW